MLYCQPKNVTSNMNGQNIKNTSSSSALTNHSIINTDTLTIIGNGTIDTSTSTYSTYDTIVNYGTLTVKTALI